MSRFKNLVLEAFNELVLAEENSYTTANDIHVINKISNKLFYAVEEKGYDYFRNNLFDKEHGAFYREFITIPKTDFLNYLPPENTSEENDKLWRKAEDEKPIKFELRFFIFGHKNPSNDTTAGAYHHIHDDSEDKFILYIAVWLKLDEETERYDRSLFKNKKAYIKNTVPYTIKERFNQLINDDRCRLNLTIKHEVGHLLDDIKRNYKSTKLNANYHSKDKNKSDIAWYMTWDELEQTYREVLIQLKDYWITASEKGKDSMVNAFKNLKHIQTSTELVNELKPYLRESTVVCLRKALYILQKENPKLYKKFLNRFVNFFLDPV